MTILHVLKYKGGWQVHGLEYPKWVIARFNEWCDNAAVGWTVDKDTFAEAAGELDRLLLEYDPEIHGEETHK